MRLPGCVLWLCACALLLSACGGSLGQGATTGTTIAPAPALQGNHLIDARTGQRLVLRGASRWSLDFTCAGDGHFAASDFAAMRGWGMHTVRFFLSTVFWRTCPGYLASVNQAITNAEGTGMVVILGVGRDDPYHLAADTACQCGQFYPMPDADVFTFWQQLATRYATDSHIIFEPWNEAHDVNWATWRDGGMVNTTSANGLAAGSYQAVGMQALVGEINALAPARLVLVSGIDWASSLAGLTAGYALQGANIFYEVHIYQRWDPLADFAPLLATVPVIAGEFGINDCCHNYSMQVMRYFEQAQTGYLAWVWAQDNASDLLAANGWDGTPSAFGQPIRAFMQQAAGGAT